MNKLPLNWDICKLSDIFLTSSGGTPKRGVSSYYGGDIPWLKSGELNNGIIYCSEEFITQEGLKNSSAKIFPKGSLLIALYGATVGKLGILDFDSTTNQAICCIYQNKNYSRNFLFYYLVYKKDYLINSGKGGAQPNISQEIIKNLELSVPPLAEQGRIVDRIEEIFAKIDAGVEKLKSAQEKIKQYKQSVLHSAFTGKLEKVSNWKHAFLKEICNKITDGSHFSPESDNSYDYPYITVKDIFNDNIMFSSAKKIKKIDYEKLVYNGCKPNIGDVLFSKDGTVGKVSLIQSNINFVVLSSLAILTPNYDKITSKFLFYMLKSPEFLSEALKNKTGVAIRRIILATLKNIKVFYPSDISEQEKIVEEIEKRFAKADKMLEVVEKSLKSAEQLKQSVLKKAFEGKLVPQNPNDEPASVLLERIKSEKQQNEKVKGKRK